MSTDTHFEHILRHRFQDKVITDHIQPGKPQQNAYVERYNRTVRHEWLEMNEFATIEEAQLTATQWLWIYNNERLSMKLGGITPAMKLAEAFKLGV